MLVLVLLLLLVLRFACASGHTDSCAAICFPNKAIPLEHAAEQ